MAYTGYVYNRSKEMYEKAKKSICPYCKGYGGTSSHPDEKCHLCDGKGYVMLSICGTGWLRPVYARMGDSRLY